jgi:dTDP-4-dehydrorhamnose 3,5-epimerase
MLRAGGSSRLTGPALPLGVRRIPFVHHPDTRGSLFEMFRASSEAGFTPVQWNVVRSHAGVLRGVHVHAVHSDYLVLVEGSALVGLRDLRSDSPTEGRAALVELRGDTSGALVVPPGVAHGFYFPEPSLHVYGVSHYWDPADELGCHWADPALGIPWPDVRPLLSDRDASAGTLGALRDALGRRRV